MNEEKRSSTNISDDTESPCPAIVGGADAPEIAVVDGGPGASRSGGGDGQSVTVAVPPKSVAGERKVGVLVAAAMKKFAVPRSSSYHGVTKLKWSGKFEAHLWDNTSQVEGRKRKGKHGCETLN